MKKYRVLLILTLGLSLLLATTHAFASPSNVLHAQNTPGAKTPGARATEKANDNTAKQADKLRGKHENFKGIVAAVDATSVTLTLRDGSSVTVSLSGETRIKFPGPKVATNSLQPGMNAMLQAIRDQGGNLVAHFVMVIPGKPSKAHRVGVVTEYSPGSSITIQTRDGSISTFALTAETKILPAERAEELTVGSRVTVIAPRDIAGGEAIAKGIVIHPPKP